MNSSHKICTILFTYQLISCSQQPQEEGTIIVPFLQMRELCGYVFCQHHTALSPGFLSSVPRCVAYYKQLSSLTFFIATAWNLPLPPPTPHGVLPVILNCWVFFFYLPPLCHLKGTVFITSPTPLKSPPSPPSMSSTDHRWLLCSCLSTCEPCKGFVSPSTLSSAVPASVILAGAPAPSGRRPWHFWKCHTWNPGKNKERDTQLSTYFGPGLMHGLGAQTPTFKGSSFQLLPGSSRFFQVYYWWAPGGSKMIGLNPSAACLWRVGAPLQLG